jgi:hypothetical protein
MVKMAAKAVKAERPKYCAFLAASRQLTRVLLTAYKLWCPRDLDAVAVHGFPLDWNWQINEWREKISEIEAVTSLPVW